jgi:hypothetical protein
MRFAKRISRILSSSKRPFEAAGAGILSAPCVCKSGRQYKGPEKPHDPLRLDADPQILEKKLRGKDSGKRIFQELTATGLIQLLKLLHRFDIAFARRGGQQHACLIAILGHAISPQV